MILYFAASFLEEDVDTIGRMGHRNMLFSFHYYGTKWLPRLREWRRKYKLTLFIDSGAFSAYTSGVSIDIQEYMKFLKSLRAPYYAVLDDLVDPDRTLANQRLMEKNGLNPLPTFHIGENIKYLEYYITRYKYMALGGMVGAENLEPWLKSVWPYIYRRRPELKVHGFGLTTQSQIQPYPFYSVDSSSYLAPSRFGIVPLWSDKKNVMYQTKYYKVVDDYKDGEKMSLEHRDRSITMAAKSYQQMIAYVNKYQKKRQFQHLLNQTTLWSQ